MRSDEMRRLLAPYLAAAVGLRHVEDSGRVLLALDSYLQLLLRWNERMNLTAIRRPEEIVSRHFGESLLLGRLLPSGTVTVLDLGSGAGFPGIPLQLGFPEVRVTLAESQGKKAAFLREVVRDLKLATEIWSGRAEALVGQRQFDVVALRAVDDMSGAVRLASCLGSKLLILGASHDISGWHLRVERQVPVPGAARSVAALASPRQEPGQ